ncbi:hypothetical protein CMUS01_11358 [Colletotrichum musicola]|uniref:Uncharacterized protein n=1 Tax=Colletotrichum musicola TaxID=2175873 RepID=A0A8H6JZQ4_9PEZI|nr:hypothetical protein CMUS01_11358 [Colletotrichum musicola]
MSWIVKFCGWLAGSDSSKSANQQDETELATRKTSSPDSGKEIEDASKKPKDSGKVDGTPRTEGMSLKKDGTKQQQPPEQQTRQPQPSQPPQHNQPPQQSQQTPNGQPQNPQPGQNPQHNQTQPGVNAQAPAGQVTTAPGQTTVPPQTKQPPQKKAKSYRVQRAFPFMESYLDMWEVTTFLDETLGVDCYRIKDEIAELQRKSGRVESDEE